MDGVEREKIKEQNSKSNMWMFSVMRFEHLRDLFDEKTLSQLHEKHTESLGSPEIKSIVHAGKTCHIWALIFERGERTTSIKIDAYELHLVPRCRLKCCFVCLMTFNIFDDFVFWTVNGDKVTFDRPVQD